MRNFLEIKDLYGLHVLINIDKVLYICDDSNKYSDEDLIYNAIIFMEDGSNIKTEQTFKQIKAKIKCELYL